MREAPIHLFAREFVDYAGGNIGLLDVFELEGDGSVRRNRRQ